MASNLFDQLYANIDCEKGIYSWTVAETAIEQNCLPWYDPRFIKGYHELLFVCFISTHSTQHWGASLFLWHFAAATQQAQLIARSRFD
ncbi:MAG: hypothetical protein AAF889_00115 [Cyanobacteria bacterium P01_D01_bin.73]